ncbi:MAG: DUF1365 domain-containing protein [Pirellulales bacterium]|nr:DUF1365 domain-containing protein [Pirellulales bacterium]
MHSCIYVGQLSHKRFVPKEHRFRYGLYMLYLDLDEVPELISDRVLSRSRFAPQSFRQEDHLGDLHKPLAESVRDLVQERTDKRPTGPVRLLSGLRCFGYYFSPLNLYYCFDPDGETLETVVAEVSNTPWRETHYYVLSDANRVDRHEELCFSHAKDFHVSPFMEMSMQYYWQLSKPGERLKAQIIDRKDSEMVFKANLSLTRRELNRRSLTGLLLRYPFMSGRIVQAIYYQAFWLWRKKCPFYPHPNQNSRPENS